MFIIIAFKGGKNIMMGFFLELFLSKRHIGNMF
jgi:hypothetical protein